MSGSLLYGAVWLSVISLNVIKSFSVTVFTYCPIGCFCFLLCIHVLVPVGWLASNIYFFYYVFIFFWDCLSFIFQKPCRGLWATSSAISCTCSWPPLLDHCEWTRAGPAQSNKQEEDIQWQQGGTVPILQSSHHPTCRLSSSSSVSGPSVRTICRPLGLSLSLIDASIYCAEMVGWLLDAKLVFELPFTVVYGETLQHSILNQS